MTPKLLTSSFVLGLLFAAQASAQTVDEIIKKNIEARGGLQKLKAIKSVRLSGKINPQGLEIPIVVQAKRPNSVRVEATFQGKSQIQAFDGETGWKVDPFQGSPDPEKVAGDDLKELQEQSDFDGSLIDYKDKGHSVQLVGKEDMEGTPVYKLKLTLKSGDVRTIYIDAENYLELKVTSKRKTPGGELEIDTYTGNYKPVNGIMMAHSIENKLKSQSMYTLTVDKIEFDVPIDDAIFKMPIKPQEKPAADKKPTSRLRAGFQFPETNH